MKCGETKSLLSSYLDGAVDGKQRRQIEEHMSGCDGCTWQYTLLRQTQLAVSGLGRKAAPPNLALRLRVTLSREMMNARRMPWESLRIRWQNAARAFMVPATAGALSAVVFFGLLIGFFALPQRLEANDVPTSLYTSPELRFSPFEIGMGNITAESIMVEVTIDTTGRIQDYTIISAPKETQQFLPQLNNMLIFTVFRPATAFGQPTTGKAVLSFSAVNVKG